MTVRFVQIVVFPYQVSEWTSAFPVTVTHHLLCALDQEGRLWQRSTQDYKWVMIPSPEEP